jgi:hypothetical protein
MLVMVSSHTIVVGSLAGTIAVADIGAGAAKTTTAVPTMVV